MTGFSWQARKNGPPLVTDDGNQDWLSTVRFMVLIRASKKSKFPFTQQKCGVKGYSFILVTVEGSDVDF